MLYRLRIKPHKVASGK